MKYVIELAWKDEENYECKEYFKSVYVDDFGIARVTTTPDPLGAKMFASVEPENRNSILLIIRNVMRQARINVKKLNYSLE